MGPWSYDWGRAGAAWCDLGRPEVFWGALRYRSPFMNGVWQSRCTAPGPLVRGHRPALRSTHQTRPCARVVQGLACKASYAGSIPATASTYMDDLHVYTSRSASNVWDSHTIQGYVSRLVHCRPA